MPPHDTRPSSVRPPVRIAAGSITATFTWAGDRWVHRIGPDPSGEEFGWESCDTPWPPADDPRWPASPVLVELSRVAVPHATATDGRPGGEQAVVGVGLAGRSHFSASIAPDPHAADTLRFEIACRLHEPPVWLGSTYRTAAELIRITAADGSAVLPRTVVWGYSVGPRGIVAVHGASVATGPA
ncbi:MAG: hypothetical protein ACKOHK_02995 [Planctomycetia bacterium]